MDLQERVYSVLLVSAAEAFNSTMTSLLPPARYQPVKCAGSISEAKRRFAEHEFDFVIINSPLPDDAGDRFAIDCCKKSAASVLLLVRSDVYEIVVDKVTPYGVFVQQKPVTQGTMLQALTWMASARERLRQKGKLTLSLDDRMEEIKTVNRAKLLLISERALSEPEAHRFLEKLAMDRCITKKQAAELVIAQQV